MDRIMLVRVVLIGHAAYHGKEEQEGIKVRRRVINVAKLKKKKKQLIQIKN